ncbi:glyoxalase III HchA [Rothia sp. CCM 9417]|uniref:glyoxalase III HchA n=1 Tax=Rothia sp. CCM 9417 TaxID=3402657 RepID=UPI003ADEE1D2
MNDISNLPTPDSAEDNAFFPSPYSLSQYTAATTDFDELYSPAKVAPGTKVLVIGTEERYMLMQNGAMFSTGNHPVETLLPLHHMVQAGAEIEVATLTGAPVKLEWWAFPQEDQAIASTWNKLKEQMKQPRRLSDLLAEKNTYAALFIPGGHGAMLNIPESTDVQEALDRALAEDQLIVSLCHGPAGFLAAGINRERNPFAGYSMCVFPDELDAGANINIGYLPGKMPWALGEALSNAGINIVNDSMSGLVHQDRNLITGDSPLASNELGKVVVKNLLERYPSAE